MNEAKQWIKDSLWLNCGWYSGNEFCLFQITVFNTIEDGEGGFIHITIFSVQFLKFYFGFGWISKQSFNLCGPEITGINSDNGFVA